MRGTRPRMLDETLTRLKVRDDLKKSDSRHDRDPDMETMSDFDESIVPGSPEDTRLS